MTATVIVEAAVFVAGCGLSAFVGGLAMRPRRHRPPQRRSSGAARSNCRVVRPSAPLFDQDHDVLRPLPFCLTDRLEPEGVA